MHPPAGSGRVLLAPSPSGTFGHQNRCLGYGGGIFINMLCSASALPTPSSNKLNTNETSALPKQDGAFIEYGPERLI